MFQDTINKIEGRIQAAGSLKEETRSELLQLLSRLKNETAELSKTHKNEAQNIIHLTDLSADEATREDRDPAKLKPALDDLSSSVTAFETSHPTLVEAVNRLATTLANMGI